MKKDPTAFTCVSYMGLSPTGSGVFYPLYAAEGVNVSFVQELGPNGEITNFLPFYDHDHFKFYPSPSGCTRRLGEPGLYAFRAPDRRVIELDHDAIGPLVRLNDPMVADEELPLLTRLALARIGNASESRQLTLLEAFLARTVGQPAVTRIAVAAHKRTARDRSAWWDRYQAEQKPAQPSNPFREMESEELFRWLFASNFSDEWVLGLVTLMRRVLYDERLFDLLVRMLSSEELDLKIASRRELLAVGRGLELYSILDGPDNNFAEAMSEHVGTGDIFSLTKAVPPDIVLNFIDHLEAASKLDVAAIDIFLDQLESEVIESTVAYALLDRVMEAPNLRATYDSRSYFAGVSRLDRLKSIVKYSGRLGLVLDPKTRRKVARLSE